MKAVLRSLLALVLGVLVAGLLVGAIESLSHVIYPPPPDFDPSNETALRAYIATLPLGAFLFVLLAWSVGTFGGAWLAARLAGQAPLVHAFVIGGLGLAAGLVTVLMIPHPPWFWVAGVLLFPSTAALGGKLAAS